MSSSVSEGRSTLSVSLLSLAVSATSWALRVRASGILSPGVVGSVSRQRVDDADGMSVSEKKDPTHGQV